MHRLTHLPAVRLLLLLLPGMLLGIHMLSLPVGWWYINAFVFLLLLLSGSVRSIRFRTALAMIQGISMASLIFLLAVTYGHFRTPWNISDHYVHFSELSGERVFRIEEILKPTQRGVQALASVEELHTEEHRIMCSGNILIYLDTSGLRQSIQPGERFLTNRMPVDPSGPKNPGAFDYRRYLETQGIKQVWYLRGDDLKRLQYDPPGMLRRWTLTSRDYARAALSTALTDSTVRGVALALIIGDRSLLDAGVRDTFSGTGTMHILAVSGLHVGILYVILEKMLLLFPLFRRRDILKGYAAPVVIVCFIWFYALLTGLSPSIFRSAIMFTFLAFGRPAGRYVNSFNILAASAITLLLIDPMMIRQVGFQLSFLAVWGIISFQPLLAGLWYPQSRILQYFWSLLTVSVGAQLGTAPISIYYFHIFPNYFLLANMVAIPLSFLILSNGMFTIVTVFLPAVSSTSGILLDHLLRSMLWCLEQLSSVPGALTAGLYPLFQVTILVYLLLWCGWLYLEHRKFFLLAAVICLAVLVTTLQELYIWRDKQKNELILFNAKGTTPVAIRQDGTAAYYSAEGGIENGLPDHLARRWLHTSTLNEAALPEVFEWQGKTIRIMKEQYLTGSVSADFVLLRTDQQLNPEELSKLEPNAVWILGNEVSSNTCRNWRSYAAANDMTCYCLRDGAVILESVADESGRVGISSLSNN